MEVQDKRNMEGTLIVTSTCLIESVSFTIFSTIIHIENKKSEEYREEQDKRNMEGTSVTSAL